MKAILRSLTRAAISIGESFGVLKRGGQTLRFNGSKITFNP